MCLLPTFTADRLVTLLNYSSSFFLEAASAATPIAAAPIVATLPAVFVSSSVPPLLAPRTAAPSPDSPLLAPRTEALSPVSFALCAPSTAA